MKNHKLLLLAPILALLSLLFPMPVYGQGDPVQSTSHYVGPIDAGAVTHLTTCPNPTVGQECTDTIVSAFQHRDDANSTITWINFLQVTYYWPEYVPVVSATFGSGPATLSITPPLLAAEATAQLDLRVCDGNLQCAPAGSASVTAHWRATSELMRNQLEISGDGATMHISTGLSQFRFASADIAVDGVAVPGVVLSQRRSLILRSREVHLCISVYPGNC
jgi:hypothetical protein